MKKIIAVKALDSIGGSKKYLNEIQNVVIEKNIASFESLEEVISNINRREKRPLKTAIMSLYSNELIVPVFSTENLNKVPSFIPVWSFKDDNNRVVTVFNITPYAKKDKDSGEIRISQKTMFGLMLGAAVFRSMSLNGERVSSSTKVLKTLTTVYSRIFTKLLDKNFAISADSVSFDQIRFLAAKFFLISCMERADDDTTNAIAMHAVTKTSTSVVLTVNDSFATEDYVDINTFIKALSTNFSRLKLLTYRTIISEIARLYKAPAVLMMEYPPYFIINILFAVVSSNINSEFSFESVLEKDGIELYKELDNLLK